MRLVHGSVRLCRMPIFIEFLSTISDTPITDEESAAAFIRTWCGVGSRGELRMNDEARKRWVEIVNRFNDSMRVTR